MVVELWVLTESFSKHLSEINLLAFLWLKGAPGDLHLEECFEECCGSYGIYLVQPSVISHLSLHLAKCAV